MERVAWGADDDSPSSPRRARRRLLVGGLVLTLVAGLAVGAVVGADGRLQEARREDSRRVLTALAAGDCTAVTVAYRSATTGRVLPGRARPAVPAQAAKADADCREVQRADALVRAGKPVDGLGAYLEFRRTHVFSPLDAQVRDRVQDVVRDERLKPDAATCRLVGQAVAPRTQGPAEAGIDLLTPCGELLARTKDTTNRDYDLAMMMFAQVRAKAPRSPEAVRAETAQAAAYFRQGHIEEKDWGLELVRPGKGPAKVTMANLTDQTLTFVVSGRGGGRFVEIKPCKGCPTFKEDSDVSVCRKAEAPAATLSVPPGTYQVAVLLTSPRWEESFYDTWKLRGGGYETCFFESDA